VTLNDLEAHMHVDRYADFRLTGAIRPGPELKVVPRQGDRINTYRDIASGLKIPVLAASVSRELLFDLFVALLEPLGEEVDVILETSHQSGGDRHCDLHRENIDRPILTSNLYDFEDLLLNDGCTGIAVVATGEPMEVQFDEHKVLVVYAHDLRPFEDILQDAGVPHDDSMKLITESEHLHISDPRHEEMFEQMCLRLAVGEPAEHAKW